MVSSVFRRLASYLTSEAAGMRTLVRGCGKAAHMGTEEEKKPNGEGPKLSDSTGAKVIDANIGEGTYGCR